MIMIGADGSIFQVETCSIRDLDTSWLETNTRNYVNMTCGYSNLHEQSQELQKTLKLQSEEDTRYVQWKWIVHEHKKLKDKTAKRRSREDRMDNERWSNCEDLQKLQGADAYISFVHDERYKCIGFTHYEKEVCHFISQKDSRTEGHPCSRAEFYSDGDLDTTLKETNDSKCAGFILVRKKKVGVQSSSLVAKSDRRSVINRLGITSLDYHLTVRELDRMWANHDSSIHLSQKLAALHWSLLDTWNIKLIEHNTHSIMSETALPSLRNGEYRRHSSSSYLNLLGQTSSWTSCRSVQKPETPFEDCVRSLLRVNSRVQVVAQTDEIFRLDSRPQTIVRNMRAFRSQLEVKCRHTFNVKRIRDSLRTPIRHPTLMTSSFFVYPMCKSSSA